MRQFHANITPGVVHQRAFKALEKTLDWKPVGRSVRVPDLLNLLLLMAANVSSLFATVRRFFSFSHETAGNAIRENLPSMDRLVQGLVQSLHDVMAFNRQDRRRHWLLAIDTHNVAYYGKDRCYVVGGPKKQGTKYFYSYATACLLHKNRRYTIALCPVLPKTKPHEIVRTLLDQIAAKGLKIKGVALDSGFDSGDTLLLLQERGLAYTFPLRRKGNARNARNRWFEGRHGLIRWMEWTTKKTRLKVRTRTLLWKRGPKIMLFAFAGWSGQRARNVHQTARRHQRLYRQRFGIETSYRQKNQAQAFTTSSDPVYRLLLEGLGYLIRQVWVVLMEELARLRPEAARCGGCILSLQQLIDWLLHELTTLYPEPLEIATNQRVA